ncbi:MAG: helix-hairpin-helix domain-containing protein [Deltaproteobacteria bacterium]|nr:helix-hairpin-helix domain-containing protein [Deltaproteobacteria bacterium]
MNLEINDRTTGFLVLLSFLLILYYLNTTLTHSRPPRASSKGDFFIEVAGDVESPGVYRFDYPPDIMELMKKAGVPNVDMASPQTSVEGPLSTGKVVTVCQEALDTRFVISEMSAFYKMTLGIPISLNKESETGLTAIPGIGPGLAKAIVQERSKRGGFQRVNDVLSVKGIGPKLYERIRPYVVL